MPEELLENGTEVNNEVPDVLTPAPEAEDQKTGDAEVDNSETETTEQQETRKQSKFQRRLERQKIARIEAETEVRLLRERIEKLEGQSKPSQVESEPKREDFEDYESYLRAVTKYDAKQVADAALKAQAEKAQGNEKQAKETQEKASVEKVWSDRESAFQKTVKDYDEVVTPFAEEELSSLGMGARQLIVDSEAGPALLYHLASNPELMDRLVDLSSVRQIAELAKIEDKLTTPAKKTSNAPAPASHVSTSKTGQKDPAKMNSEEYKAFMKANGSRFVR